MTILTGNQIEAGRFLALRQMLKLEMKGMSRSKGRSAYAILKDDYGLRGTRAEVLKQADAIREQLLTPQGESND